ncbi:MULTISPECIES: ammonium transporter [Rhodococcus]|uniref:ammonium transporter n=1 Tax=Rhodococcus TaxID=1827 RepID=UPI00096AAD00|nr:MULTISPECIES: ammonium transporter [unclassified Rhodococcus (in: high G+C Gram-positive bacteria)]
MSMEMVLAEAVIDSGDTAWVLISAGLVLFMVPGLAFFYAGLVRGSSALVMLQQNLVPLGLVSITWVVFGYSFAFSGDWGSGFLGDLKLFGLQDIHTAAAPGFHLIEGAVAVPTLAFVVYQMMFAIITPALITGATANRLKPLGWAVLLVLWSIIVYPPIAHWLFNPEGWLALRGAQDWAGGIVVHASAGAAALAILLVVGKRPGWPNAEAVPHSVPLALIGAGILWFGWFGFNAGDGLAADGVAAQALMNTHIAAAGGMVVWLVIERYTEGKATAIGGITGAVAGLATVTPCAGFVSTFSALAIGALAGLVCHFALALKSIFKFDDALDVIAVHFIGGILGSLLLGLFGEKAINSIGRDGLFFGGGAGLLGEQALALIVVIAFSFVVTWLIATGIEKTIGLKLAPKDQVDIDRRQQGMDAYRYNAAFVGAGGAPQTSGFDSGVLVEGAKLVPNLGAPKHELITAVLQTIESEKLREALLAAGAESIVVSEAHVSASDSASLKFRGQRNDVVFTERLRVEVLVASEHAQAVLDAINEYSGGRRSGFVQQAAEPLTEATEQGS